MQVLERLFFISFLIAISFLSFVFGSALTVTHPRSVALVLKGVVAAYHQLAQTGLTPYKTTLWNEARYATSGVVVYDRHRAYDGLTLFTSGHAQKAQLVTMDGRIVHEWHLPFSEAWAHPTHVEDVPGDKFVHWHEVHLYPNGDLLAVYVTEHASPHGFGLAKMDARSNVIWRLDERTHHAVDVGPDGRIYTLTEEIRTEPLPGIAQLDPPFLHDSLAVLSAQGELVKKISIVKAFRDSDYAAVLDLLPADARGDVTHTNDVEVVTEAIAERYAFLEEGQVLISLRQIDTIAVLDPETETIEWALRGPWRAPHDPDFLPDGNMLIFDNRGHIGPGGRSRVVEFDPRTQAIVWVYSGSEERPFYSKIRSGQQRLPNGNTLITESDAGRIFEVTPAGEIVWELVNPNRGGPGDRYVAIVSAVHRFSADELEFLSEQQLAQRDPGSKGEGDVR